MSHVTARKNYGNLDFRFAILIALCLCTIGMANSNNSFNQISQDQVPEGLSQSEWVDIQAQIIAKRYNNHPHQQGYLKAFNADIGDLFGLYVDVSGDTVVVGAIYEDSSTTGVNSTPNELAEDSGAAYIFIRSGGSWIQQAYLKASNPEEDDHFGSSVAVSGDTVIVGACSEDGNSLSTLESPNNEALDAGAVYVFNRVGSNWTQQAYLKASNADSGDFFGCSVALSGDILVVGADLEDGDSSSTTSLPNDSKTNAGAAYVFIRSGNNWKQQAYLKASNTGVSDSFGSSVDVSGDTVVVGARYESGNSTSTVTSPNNLAFHAGAAYVFIRSGSNWSQQAYLKAFNAGAEDAFGGSVAVSGDTVVVGAYSEDGDSSSSITVPNNSSYSAGAAYVYIRSVNNWSLQAYLKASNAESSDFFGTSVALSDNTLVVGADLEDGDSSSTMGTPNNLRSGAGAAYVFLRSGSSWTQKDYLKAFNTDYNDLFGYSVAIFGETIVAGAYFESGDSSSTVAMPNNLTAAAGAVYVFDDSMFRNGFEEIPVN